MHQTGTLQEGKATKFLHSWTDLFLTTYTVYYNRRHRRSGHLFQRRYKAILIEADNYLLNMSIWHVLKKTGRDLQKGKPARKPPDSMK